MHGNKVYLVYGDRRQIKWVPLLILSTEGSLCACILMFRGKAQGFLKSAIWPQSSKAPPDSEFKSRAVTYMIIPKFQVIPKILTLWDSGNYLIICDTAFYQSASTSDHLPHSPFHWFWVRSLHRYHLLHPHVGGSYERISDTLDCPPQLHFENWFTNHALQEKYINL